MPVIEAAEFGYIKERPRLGKSEGVLDLVSATCGVLRVEYRPHFAGRQQQAYILPDIGQLAGDNISMLDPVLNQGGGQLVGKLVEPRKGEPLKAVNDRCSAG